MGIHFFEPIGIVLAVLAIGWFHSTARRKEAQSIGFSEMCDRYDEEKCSEEKYDEKGFIFICECVSSLSACDAFKDKYDAGYDDGWAAGYNTTCKYGDDDRGRLGQRVLQ